MFAGFKTKLLASLLVASSLMLSANAFAVTGDTDITAATGGSFYGYIAGSLGSAASPTLSDGKTIAALVEHPFVANLRQLQFRVTGFSSNPGSTYFNNIYVTSCEDGSLYQFSSTSASLYAYGSGSGTATWIWTLPPNSSCMNSTWDTFYNVAVD